MDAADGERRAARRALALAASVTVLVGAIAYFTVERLHAAAADAVPHPGPASSAAQTETDIVEQARDVVVNANLAHPSGGYLLMSCKNRTDPPYQGVVYVDFDVPPGVGPQQYFQGLAGALVAHGWREGLPTNQHAFGKTLSKGGVTALVYPRSDSPARGVARVYGLCHDLSDRRDTSLQWTDVTDQLQQAQPR